MGAILSTVQNACFTIITALKALSGLNAQYLALLRRASAPPGIPVSNPTPSYWLDDPPFPDIPSIRPALPEEADVVIIGSGITGAAIAKTILDLSSGGARPRIVICEARDLCSGATGRNGGHIKCVPYEVFANLRVKLGEERATEIVRFQRRHLDVLMQLGVGVPEGEVREVETVDLYLEENDFEKVKGDIEDARQWLPEVDCRVWEAEEARKEVSIRGGKIIILLMAHSLGSTDSLQAQFPTRQVLYGRIDLSLVSGMA